MERAKQIKLVVVDSDISKGLPELNKILYDMQSEGSHEIHDVKPFGSSGQIWQITYMHDYRGTQEAREGLNEITY